jgi:hypothetical protein
MNKNAFKYLISAALFIDICSIAVIGLLLGFVIPKGGRASNYFLGLHRHEWVDVHLFLSILLLTLLIFHLWFNWTWIVQATKRYFGDRWKNALWFISGAWILVLIVGWIATRL